jgi:hypothetical protein
MELKHTDREYEAELRSLRESVLSMGARTVRHAFALGLAD